MFGFVPPYGLDEALQRLNRWKEKLVAAGYRVIDEVYDAKDAGRKLEMPPNAPPVQCPP